ncbi:MAG: ParB/RepB/Spo0J family partition protein [Ruminococcaceae bacterium]|nr:ParB/RepB/Spo0J family partition protein [Oscillospiraceae bacterium]
MAEKPKKGLGMGLEALFGEALYAEKTGSEAEKGITSLPIAKVEPREDQPRRRFDEEALEALADSIREYGLISPITVRELENGYYQIIAGERRWRASRLAGLTEVPVRVIKADERLATELALIENLQREDLNPVEEALGYKRLIEEYGLSQEETARRIGKARPTVTNALRLLLLTDDILDLVVKGLLSGAHARALIPVEPPEARLAAAKKVIAEGLSVRRTEALARQLKRKEKEPVSDKEVHVDYVKEVTNKLEKTLGRKVTMNERGSGGTISLSYYGSYDREALIEALSNINTLKE